jgi:hypothetical protein
MGNREIWCCFWDEFNVDGRYVLFCASDVIFYPLYRRELLRSSQHSRYVFSFHFAGFSLYSWGTQWARTPPPERGVGLNVLWEWMLRFPRR